MALTIGTNTWLSLEDAEAYMNLRYGSWEFWTDATQKEAALATAHRLLSTSDRFNSLPDTATQKMKDAQCEMALFLVAEGGDLLRRKGLQAQGVLSAGVSKETYDASVRNQIPFPPEVLALLEDYTTVGDNFFSGDLRRDDNEDV